MEHDGTMNRGRVKEDREGCVFPINRYIRWPKARHGSLGIWRVKLTSFKDVSQPLCL